jgi:hypothetical protein
MTDHAIDNRRLWALVIGIGEYDIGPEWNLDGGVHSAVEFASCLYRSGISLENISLCLSPPYHCS